MQSKKKKERMMREYGKKGVKREVEKAAEEKERVGKGGEIVRERVERECFFSHSSVCKLASTFQSCFHQEIYKAVL